MNDRSSNTHRLRNTVARESDASTCDGQLHSQARPYQVLMFEQLVRPMKALGRLTRYITEIKQHIYFGTVQIKGRPSHFCLGFATAQRKQCVVEDGRVLLIRQESSGAPASEYDDQVRAQACAPKSYPGGGLSLLAQAAQVELDLHEACQPVRVICRPDDHVDVLVLEVIT